MYIVIREELYVLEIYRESGVIDFISDIYVYVKYEENLLILKLTMVLERCMMYDVVSKLCV